MFAWLVGAIWLLAVVFWFWGRRKAVNSPDVGLALGGAGLSSYGIGWPRGGSGFTPSGGADGHQRPRDPFSGVRHPITRRPSGNSAAVAVEEPDDDETLTLVGVSR